MVAASRGGGAEGQCGRSPVPCADVGCRHAVGGFKISLMTIRRAVALAWLGVAGLLAATASVAIISGAPWGQVPRATLPAGLATTSPIAPSTPPYPLSGRVVRLVPGGMVVESAGRQFDVSFGTIVDVWKETSVPASAIDVGDSVFIDGGRVWANGGRIDGVIQQVDATGMLLEVTGPYGPRGSQRVDFSRYLVYGDPAANVATTREDLIAGRAIGAVVYGRPGDTLRATRIWISK